MRRWALLAMVFSLVLAVAGCGIVHERAEGGKGGREGGKDAKGGGGRGGGGRRQQKVPVEVRRVQAYPVEYSIEAVGSVQAYERIDVVARVAGVVEKVSFEEGTRVTRGQKMADIDPARFQLALAAAKATQGRAVAALKEAELALERRSRLAKMGGGLVSGEEVAAALGKVGVLTAELEQQKVAVEVAELDLRESDVRSPVDGVIQSRPIQTGMFVQRGSTIATLLRRDPMLLKFSVPGTEAARIRIGMTVRFTVPGIDDKLSAQVSHIAAAADPGSRMVEITGRINDPNKELLKPGSFAEVTVPVDSQAENPVIPLAAVRPSERGFLAYVFENGKAKERVLKLGLRTPGGQVEVRGGISPGEMLIVRGTDAVRDGADVEIEQPKKPSPESSPAASPESASVGELPPASPAPEQARRPVPPAEPAASPSAAHHASHKETSR